LRRIRRRKLKRELRLNKEQMDVIRPKERKKGRITVQNGGRKRDGVSEGITVKPFRYSGCAEVCDM
jgi:hypothetical protein